MTHLIFYEKPGCAGNARQRAILEESGHTLERRDLRTESWTRERLLSFLAPLPVAAWFNKAAPRVKTGEIVPEDLGAEQALTLLLADPLLIRRPLMQRADDRTRLVGFNPVEVARFVGSSTIGLTRGCAELEGCAASSQSTTCQTTVGR